MENKLIDIKDLEIGDEIIITCQSHMKYLKVLAKPKIGKRIHWSTKQPLYSGVRCSTNLTVTQTTHTGYAGKQWTQTHKEWGVKSEDHNFVKSFDLEYRQLWLVKRDSI